MPSMMGGPIIRQLCVGRYRETNKLEDLEEFPSSFFLCGAGTLAKDSRLIGDFLS